MTALAAGGNDSNQEGLEKASARIELWVFRVEEGLGNACVVIFPDGSAAVVDWGTKRDAPLDKLLGLLRRSATPKLQFVAATHPHADHTLGIERLLLEVTAAGIPVGRLIYPTPIDGKSSAHLRNARICAKALNIPMSSVGVSTLPEAVPAPVLATGSAKDETGELVRWKLRVLAPSDTAIAREDVSAELRGTAPGNPSSLVLQFSFERNGSALDRGRAILPGDATPATLSFAYDRSERFPELSLVNDAVVIPHHGSKHNWVSWFEDAIKGYALVSAPSGKRHHPGEDTLIRLAEICGRGSESRLCCTSFAGSCYDLFGEAALRRADAPGKQDPCFGDIGISLSADQAPNVIACDSDGPKRRPYGHCAAAKA